MTFYKLYKKLFPNQIIRVFTEHKKQIDIEYEGAAKDIGTNYYNAKIKSIAANNDGDIWIELK